MTRGWLTVGALGVFWPALAIGSGAPLWLAVPAAAAGALLAWPGLRASAGAATGGEAIEVWDESPEAPRPTVEAPPDTEGDPAPEITLISTSDLLDACGALEFRVIQVLQQVSLAAEQVETGSNHTLDAMCVTTQRTQEAQVLSSEVQQTMHDMAGVAQELGRAVRAIDQQAQSTAQIATEAVDTAQRTDARVRGLSTSAEQIGDIVKLISDVARQTRLLALNAAIEAERAGESGRGFAVVADQVRALAQKTGESATNIESMIGSVRSEILGAAAAIEDIQRSVSGFHEVSSAIGQSVAKQVSATEQIASQIISTGKHVHEIDGGLQEMADAVLNTGAHAGDSLKASALFRVTGRELTKVVLDFLKELREGSLGKLRAHERKQVSPKLVIRVDGHGEGLAHDLSKSGMLLELPERLDVGTRVTIHLEGLGTVDGEVVRHADDKMGIQFSGAVEDRPWLNDFLDTLEPSGEPATPAFTEEAGDTELWL